MLGRFRVFIPEGKEYVTQITGLAASQPENRSEVSGRNEIAFIDLLSGEISILLSQIEEIRGEWSWSILRQLIYVVIYASNISAQVFNHDVKKSSF